MEKGKNMKLRNKKTGEIHEITKVVFLHDMVKKFIIYSQTEDHNYAYKNLSELNEEWEDVSEEPKDYWFIHDLNGKPMKCKLRYWNVRDFTEWSEKRKQIGNYFETKEEAELAVRKLKAWKRLRNKGFRFENFVTYAEEGRGKVGFKWDEIKLEYEKVFYDDLTLIFGGED